MMNKYPMWKNVFIVLVVAICSVYALPNLYGEDPALQITPARAGKIDSAVKDTLADALDKASLAVKDIEIDSRQILVRFPDTETQLKAVDYVKAALGKDYVTALNLAPATPAWLEKLNALPMYLGLDLRGGVHFLMEVDMDAAVKGAIQRYSDEMRKMLRDDRIRYAMIRAEDKGSAYPVPQ